MAKAVALSYDGLAPLLQDVGFQSASLGFGFLYMLLVRCAVQCFSKVNRG